MNDLVEYEVCPECSERHRPVVCAACARYGMEGPECDHACTNYDTDDGPWDFLDPDDERDAEQEREMLDEDRY